MIAISSTAASLPVFSFTMLGNFAFNTAGVTTPIRSA
ncbi:secreted protein [marine sediment metagenome]|uniref:Secreted protein n=1 Tax=marine sediment metagenome TaxID=412755 RepID=A0A1B6NQB4_9ZZZZ